MHFCSGKPMHFRSGVDTDRHAEEALDRLRPQWIDLEHRALDRVALCLRLVLQEILTDAETDNGRNEGRVGDDLGPPLGLYHGRPPYWFIDSVGYRQPKGNGPRSRVPFRLIGSD